MHWGSYKATSMALNAGSATNLYIACTRAVSVLSLGGPQQLSALSSTLDADGGSPTGTYSTVAVLAWPRCSVAAVTCVRARECHTRERQE